MFGCILNKSHARGGEESTTNSWAQITNKQSVKKYLQVISQTEGCISLLYKENPVTGKRLVIQKEGRQLIITLGHRQSNKNGS